MPSSRGSSLPRDQIQVLHYHSQGGLQYSCLGNPRVRGAWQATVHGVSKTPNGLSSNICEAPMEGFPESIRPQGLESQECVWLYLKFILYY